MFVDAVSNGDVFGMIKIGVACFVKESRCQMPQQVEVAIVNRLAGRDPAVVSVSRGRFGACPRQLGLVSPPSLVLEVIGSRSASRALR